MPPKTASDCVRQARKCVEGEPRAAHIGPKLKAIENMLAVPAPNDTVTARRDLGLIHAELVALPTKPPSAVGTPINKAIKQDAKVQRSEGVEYAIGHIECALTMLKC